MYAPGSSVLTGCSSIMAIGFGGGAGADTRNPQAGTGIGGNGRMSVIDGSSGPKCGGLFMVVRFCRNVPSMP